jgi:hypothetical protein
MAHLLLDICLSDIPRERIKEARNGKKYLKIEVSELREKDERDNDHSIKVYVPKAEREEGVKPTYIGRGKTIGGNSPSASGNSRTEYTDGKTARTCSGYKAEGNKTIDPNADLPF